MSRYIDADKLTVYFEALAKQAEMEGLYNMAHIHNRCLQIIEDAPTADVVEVRHGHWIEHTAKPNWLEDDVEVYYNCSVCGTSHWSIAPPFCPNCGAKMDGERSANGT